MLLPMTLIDRGDFRIMARQAGKFDERERNYQSRGFCYLWGPPYDIYLTLGCTLQPALDRFLTSCWRVLAGGELERLRLPP